MVTPLDDVTDPLPVHLTGFVGRTRELGQLAAQLAGTRLLTLTGAGGSGKTRLAREVAAAVLADYERVAWVDLAVIADGDLVARQVAKSLSVIEHANIATADLLMAAIGDTRLLLVLDNCEHLVDACAYLTESLLLGCRQLSVLATSREPLGVVGETAWLVPKLDASEAEWLFAERARAAQPSFAITEGNREAVHQICERLDGIPLAIELAAARVRVLSPRQIAARLDDVFGLLTNSSRVVLPRHRTLRNTMAWSYDLLSAREQMLLRRLAVFAGSFSLEAAEAVCVDGSSGTPVHTSTILEAHDVLDGVAALVDKSLVMMEPSDTVSRYRLLETVRQYALERLQEAGEVEQLRSAHARYYLRFAQSFAPLLLGGEHIPGLLAQVTRENDNLRVAAAWALADETRAIQALQFADALFWYWYGTGYRLGKGQFNEARLYVSAALEHGAAAPPELRGRVYLARGLTQLAQGEWSDARDAFAHAHDLLRPFADAGTMAIVLAKQGAAQLMLGNLPDAHALLRSARAYADRVEVGMVHGFLNFWQGLLDLTENNIDALRTSRAEALRVSKALEQHRTIRAHHSMLMARGELREGQLIEAARMLREAWTLHETVGDGWGLSNDLETVSMLLDARGDYRRSARVMGATDGLRARIATAMLGVDHADRLQRVANANAALGAAVFEAEYHEGYTLDVAAVSQLILDVTSDTSDPHEIHDVHAVRDASHAVTGAVYTESAITENTVRPAPLRVRALGPLQVFVDDVPVAAAAWGSARPRELLVYLLLHPEGVTKEQVGLALWPDASTAQLRNSFHVTTYRLRKALGGTDWIVLRGDRYVVNPQLIAEFDAGEFEHAVAAVRRHLITGDDSALSALEEVLARYRGDLLDGEPVGDWHVSHRARLQRVYVDALLDLAAWYEHASRDERAVEAYGRVLARDPLHEHAVRALMQSFVRLGDHAQALRVMQRFTERLRRDLGVNPETATLQLAEHIRSAVGV